MSKAVLGAAWSEAVKDAPDRRYYRVLLDLGVLGALACRIVENAKRTNEKAPTHLVFFSPLADGEDVRIGALWPYRNPDSGAEYLTGHLELGSLGQVELKGGAKLDLRLLKERLGIRLSELRERASDRSPTHQLWLMTPRSKAPTVAASKVGGPGPGTAHVDGAESQVPDVAGIDDMPDDDAIADAE